MIEMDDFNIIHSDQEIVIFRGRLKIGVGMGVGLEVELEVGLEVGLKVGLKVGLEMGLEAVEQLSENYRKKGLICSVGS